MKNRNMGMIPAVVSVLSGLFLSNLLWRATPLSAQSLSQSGDTQFELSRFAGQFAPTAPPNFFVPPIFPTDEESQQMAVADFNGDGNLDLAVSTYEGIDILLGNGDGTFQSKRLVSGPDAFGIIVADMNNDGIPDLVVTTRKYSLPSGLEVLIGNATAPLERDINMLSANTQPPSPSEISMAMAISML